MKFSTFLAFSDIFKSTSYKAVGGIEVEWSKLITDITWNCLMKLNKLCTDYSEEI